MFRFGTSCGDECDCGASGCVLGVDSFDRANESPATGWTAEAGGPFAVVSNELDMPTSASLQMLTFDAGPTTGSAIGIQVKLFGDANDVLGVGIFNDVNNYVLVTVKISGTVGRMEYTEVSGGAPTFTYTRDLECIDPDLDVPAGEWLTLTAIWTNGGHAHSCFSALDGKADFNAILETSAGTHLMAAAVPEIATGQSAMLIASNTSANSRFNDFMLFNPIGPCDTIQTCCIAPAIAVEDGWTEAAAGQFDLYPAGTPPYVTSDTMGALRLVDEEYWNDNLALTLDIGFTATSIDIADWAAYGARWRMYFSYTVGNRFFVEMSTGKINETFLLYQFTYRLWHDSTLLAWMDIWASQGGLGSGTFEGELVFAELAVRVWDCQIWWGFEWLTSLGVFGLFVDGGVVGGAEFSAANVRGVAFCAGDAFSLNHAGKVGIGVGSDTPVDPIAFSGFDVTCQEEFTCVDDPPETEPPDDDPEDPGDPTGCCTGTGWDDLEVGDAVEVTIANVVYFLGPPCPDALCDLTSAFLTALNATHSCSIISKSTNGMVIFRRLSLTNPCDVCFSIDGAPLTIEIMVKIYINEDGDCMMNGMVGSNCGGCDMNYESSAFSAGADCEALTLNYVSGGVYPPEEANNGTSSTLTLNVP